VQDKKWHVLAIDKEGDSAVAAGHAGCDEEYKSAVGPLFGMRLMAYNTYPFPVSLRELTIRPPIAPGAVAPA
jgi:hypothetical protein